MVFIVISLSGCFSHWQGDLAKIVISFGGESRALFYSSTDTEILKQLKHEVIFTNETDKLKFSFTGMTFEAYIVPGEWNVSVVSYRNDNVYAAGSEDVVLKSGQDNRETIKMYQAHQVKFDSNKGNGEVQPIVIKAKNSITLPGGRELSKSGNTFGGWNTKADGTGTNFAANSKYTPTDNVILYAKWGGLVVEGDTLDKKLSWIKRNAVDGVNYIITADNDETLNPQTLSYNNKTVSITLKGDTKMRTVNLSTSVKGSLFTVGSGVTFTLDGNITLKGHSNNDKPLIYVSSSGKLIMNTGTVITGNKSTTEFNVGTVGGGVWISEGGYFLLDGGTINKNITKYSGGGVISYGEFMMRKGFITENVAGNNGAGVVIGGKFTMIDGYIYGNKADGTDNHPNDNSHGGGGVVVWGNGEFIMEGGNIYLNEVYGKGNNIGGGLHISGNAKFTMKGGKIYSNTAINDGGGVHMWGDKNDNPEFTMKGGQIYKNTVTNGNGGGVSMYVNIGGSGKGTFIMDGGIIYENVAKDNNSEDDKDVGHGGGVNVSDNVNFIMNGGEIYGNHADGDGGGVVVSGTLTMNGGEIRTNTSDRVGGGVRVWNGIFDKPKKTNGGIIKDNNAIYGKTISADNDNHLDIEIDYEIQANHIRLYYNGKTGETVGFD